MLVTDKGLLVYIGNKGVLYEITGGKDGQIAVRKL